jgi:hypothetical protein
MGKNVLLLTATITPQKGIPSLAHRDPDQRRADYASAFRFYLGLLGPRLDGIVFIENSSSDLANFEALAREAGAADKVELISFHGQDSPPGYGRAYGEFRMLEHAVEHSEILRGGGEDLIVWKMTGRYLTTNLPQLIATQPRAFDLYCNLRNHPLRWADMYLLAWNRVGYEGIIQGLAPRLREDTCVGAPEGEFRRVIDEARRRYNVVPRFRHVPRIDGVRGYDNKNYTQGLGRGKLLARRIALKVAPWLWI